MRRKAVGGLWCLSLLPLCLSGCISLPGGEPFVEKTYSGETAQSVYEEVAYRMGQIDLEDWKGYSFSSDCTIEGMELYRTEEYTVACYNDNPGDYLWYKGCLYFYTQDELLYRDMEWEELQAERFVRDKWELACRLSELEEAELTYKYIPMAAEHKNLLKAKYAET